MVFLALVWACLALVGPILAQEEEGEEDSFGGDGPLIQYTEPVLLRTPHPYTKEDSNRTWKLCRMGAKFVRLHFSFFSLHHDDYVEFTDPKGGSSSRIYGSERFGDVWGFTVFGDTIVMRLHVAENSTGAFGFLAEEFAFALASNSSDGEEGLEILLSKETNPDDEECVISPPLGYLPETTTHDATLSSNCTDSFNCKCITQEEFDTLVEKQAKRRAKNIPSDQMLLEQEEYHDVIQPNSVCGENGWVDAMCERDIASDLLSSQQFQAARDAVAWTNTASVAQCTATKVGDGLEYGVWMTNNHCFSTTHSARNTEVRLQYRLPGCTGEGGINVHHAWAERVLYTSMPYDVTFFTVASSASETMNELTRNAPCVPIDPKRLQSGESIYILHHPGGAPLKLSYYDDVHGDDCRIEDADAAGRVGETDISYWCDTREGSSGSPVLDRSDHSIVALHHWGGCPNRAVELQQALAPIIDTVDEESGLTFRELLSCRGHEPELSNSEVDCLGSWSGWQCQVFDCIERRTYKVYQPASKGGRECEREDGAVETRECPNPEQQCVNMPESSRVRYKIKVTTRDLSVAGSRSVTFARLIGRYEESDELLLGFDFPPGSTRQRDLQIPRVRELVEVELVLDGTDEWIVGMIEIAEVSPEGDVLRSYSSGTINVVLHRDPRGGSTSTARVPLRAAGKESFSRSRPPDNNKAPPNVTLAPAQEIKQGETKMTAVKKKVKYRITCDNEDWKQFNWKSELCQSPFKDKTWDAAMNHFERHMKQNLQRRVQVNTDPSLGTSIRVLALHSPRLPSSWRSVVGFLGSDGRLRCHSENPDYPWRVQQLRKSESELKEGVCEAELTLTIPWSSVTRCFDEDFEDDGISDLRGTFVWLLADCADGTVQARVDLQIHLSFGAELEFVSKQT